MENDDRISQQLDTVISILRIAHRDEIMRTRERIRDDKVNAAILELTGDWIPAGKLKTGVMKKAKQSKPTVERRIASLLEEGVIEKQGAGGHVSYRSTGLI